MSELPALIATLKRLLKARGLTYRDVAGGLGLSETSVKRLFSSMATMIFKSPAQFRHGPQQVAAHPGAEATRHVAGAAWLSEISARGDSGHGVSSNLVSLTSNPAPYRATLLA